MTQPPQQQNYTPGTVMDEGRSRILPRCWPAGLVTWTVTVGGTATAGIYSFNLGGIAVSFDRQGAETNADIAAELLADYQSNPSALKVANGTLNGLVLTFAAYSADDTFAVDSAVAPGAGTLVAADTTVADETLEIGLGVAQDAGDKNNIRKMATGDTDIFGVVVEGSQMRSHTGDVSENDAYDAGQSTRVMFEGNTPVWVDEAIDIAIGDPVFVRIIAAGTEKFGAFRLDADGGDAVAVSNARWEGESYLDHQGRKVAELRINKP